MRLITTTPDWRPPEGIGAISSTRLGGASRGELAFANFSLNAGEAAATTAANRAALLDQAGLEAIQWLRQVHGSTCVRVDQCHFPLPQADAAYSQSPGIGLAILTADCLPVFLATASEIAVLHLGWRSLAADLIANSLKHFRAARRSIVAGFGPAICPRCFEIGAEVREQFLRSSQASAEHFSRSQRAGHYLADLPAIARWQLLNLGLRPVNIGNSGACTKCQPQLYYSHRSGSRGRIVSVIFRQNTTRPLHNVEAV